jgi:pseudaminic acid biosynthesis-associated methylase
MTDEATSEPPTDLPSAGDLESMWAGEFGDAYVARNAAPIAARRAFWQAVLSEFSAGDVLEVGCAHGEELGHLATLVDPRGLVGLDINTTALAEARRRVPAAGLVRGVARYLPFRDRSFDAVFTIGLLIHQPDDTLPLVMRDIARCSRRWVMCGEYFAEETIDINYRDRPGILFKRDYGRLYQVNVPGLTLRQSRELTQDETGFDRVTWHVFEVGA